MADKASLKNHSSTPIHHSYKLRPLKSRKERQRRRTPIHVTVDRSSLLLEAIDSSNAEAVQMLLEKGAAANINTGKQFLIHRAVARGNTNIVKHLINHGAKVDSLDIHGQTPLFIAVIHKNSEMLKILLELGASLDIRSKQHMTILEFAEYMESRVDIFEVLFFFGAWSACTDIIGSFDYWLLMAASYGMPDVIRILLRHGVSINIKDECGRTPLHLAAKNDLTKHRSCGLVMYLLVAEVVILQETKRKVLKENKRVVKNKKVRNIYNSCVEKIGEMKDKKIVKGVSYFDILVAEEYKLASYIRNVQVMEILKKAEYKTEFPHYSERLEACIEIGKTRNKLLPSSSELLKKIFKFKLPDEIVHEILNYFKITDLRVFNKILIR